MDLEEFLRQTQAEVRSQMTGVGASGLSASGNGNAGQNPYSELVFAEVVMQHMSEIGMTFEPVLCHHSAKVGNAIVRLSGYAISEDSDQLDLFVSLYSGTDDLVSIPDVETKTAAEQCVRFLARTAEGRMAKTMDQSTDAYAFAVTIQDCYANLDQLRIYVLTDRQAKAKNFVPREIRGKTVKLEVMDIERLFRHWSEGKPRDELVVNFEEVSGGALPCVYVPRETSAYDYALTVIPGEALRFLYEKYGARLLEANVRSFLSATGKVNKGIRDTLRDNPEMFLAYNNGIVIIADELRLGESPLGGPGIKWMKGLQIVNGGQTTASIYFSKKKNSDIDLRRVRVPAKVIIIQGQDPVAEEDLISSISRFANSQNAIKQADLSANKPYHVELERISTITFCPDGTGRWFYERAAGSYNVMLAKEGTTPARLRQIKDAIPSSRRVTKTDLAKYLNAWDRKPHSVSQGSQKNFAEFMKDSDGTDGTGIPLPDVAGYKQMIAKAIIFKVATKLVRKMFPAFQANVGAYLVAVVADRVGDRVELDRIWAQQDLSPQFTRLLQDWASEVNRILHESASGRMVSEWAKKIECWDVVQKGHFALPEPGIPELR